MIVGIRHSGIMVEDFDESLKFYKKLGMEIIYNEVEDWGGDIGKIKVAKMKVSDKNIFEITERYKCYRGYYWGDNGYYGTHLCFLVDNLKKTLKELGDVSFNLKPRLSPDKSVKIAFIYDPDGFKLELVEKIK